MLPPPRELPDKAPRLAQGRYVMLARIGKGGMAGVYAAWDTRIDEWRAIKVLFPKHARDQSLRRRFENEAQTMVNLSHPNLVRVFDVGRAQDKLPYMVMELVSGGSLYRWTKTHGGMPPRMAVEAMLQLCAGVEAVHQAGVVHRDIKPRNVLINWDGVLKLTDFGIAQLEDSSETRTGLAMGTLGFMSPEQLHDAKSVDHRTDIYAVGATLWAQLTGRKARDLFRLEDKPQLFDGVPEPLQPLLRTCLAYERDERYAAIGDLTRALTEVIEVLPEDPPDAPPLALNLGPMSLKSRPENTFSEILTTRDSQVSDASISGGSSPPSQITGNTGGTAGEHTPVPSGLPMHGYSVRPTIDPSRSAADVLTSDDDQLPSYMVGVDQPDRERKFEVIGEGLEELRPGGAGEEETKQRSRLWYAMSAILLTPVALVLGAALTLAVAAGIGWAQVDTAAEHGSEARAELVDRVALADTFVDDLERLGADPAPALATLAAFRSAATEAEQLQHAVAFVDTVERTARPLLLTLGDAPHEEQVVRQRLERLTVARDAHVEHHRAWLNAASTPHGRLAVRLSLAEEPWGVE